MVFLHITLNNSVFIYFAICICIFNKLYSVYWEYNIYVKLVLEFRECHGPCIKRQSLKTPKGNQKPQLEGQTIQRTKG